MIPVCFVKSSCQALPNNGNDLVALFILNGVFPRTRSDASGRFVFNRVPTGRYVIETGSETSFDSTDGGTTNLKSASGVVLVLKLESGQVMDLGKVLVEKWNHEYAQAKIHHLQSIGAH
jgi:hypothetical protein